MAFLCVIAKHLFVLCEPPRCIIIRSGIYNYRLKTKHKYQQLVQTLWLTSRQHVSAELQPKHVA